MDSSIKAFLYAILIFGFLSIGTETYRYVKIQTDIQETIETIAVDSMELAMKDDFREDNISVMDSTICQDMLYDHLKETFDLDASLNPPPESYIKEFTLDNLVIVPGEYTVDLNDKPTQTVNPTLYIKGFIKIKPLIIGLNTLIDVPFEYNSQNKRL